MHHRTFNPLLQTCQKTLLACRPDIFIKIERTDPKLCVHVHPVPRLDCRRRRRNPDFPLITYCNCGRWPLSERATGRVNLFAVLNLSPVPLPSCCVPSLLIPPPIVRPIIEAINSCGGMNVITKERDDEDDAFANIERLLRDITRGKKTGS